MSDDHGGNDSGGGGVIGSIRPDDIRDPNLPGVWTRLRYEGDLRAAAGSTPGNLQLEAADAAMYMGSRDADAHTHRARSVKAACMDAVRAALAAGEDPLTALEAIDADAVPFPHPDALRDFQPDARDPGPEIILAAAAMAAINIPVHAPQMVAARYGMPAAQAADLFRAFAVAMGRRQQQQAPKLFLPGAAGAAHGLDPETLRRRLRGPNG